MNGSSEGNSEQQTITEAGGNVRTSKKELETAAAQMWTLADMQTAEPYPLPEPSQQDIEKAIQKMEQALVGVPESTAATAGAGTVVAGGLPEEVELEQNGEVPTATTGGYDYPAPYTRHENLCSYSIYPWITVGKLFFTQGGGRFVCSAASIGNNAIWTAGHCVHAGNNSPAGWSTNVVFVPAYRDGATPFGQWPASWLATRTVWYQNGNPNGLTEDMGGGCCTPMQVRRSARE